MTDPFVTPEMPDTAATVHFLRRFADLMSNGQNATYLHHAAGLLETLTARVIAAVDEEQLWRYKYETVTRHADALEAECAELKRDIDGHVNIASAILSERDALRATLKGREAELSELSTALNSERKEFSTKLEAQEKILAEFRDASDRERNTLNETAKLRGEQLDELRQSFDRERDELRTAINTAENGLTELRLSLERARTELKARDGELETLRVASGSESGELRARVAHLEAKRAELRSALERIGDLRSQAKPYEGADSSVPAKREPQVDANAIYKQPDDRRPEVGETNIVVSEATLRQARAQFEYLAGECVLRGDIASQVMCELGAYTLDLALSVRVKTSQLPVSAVAFNILASPGSMPPVIAKTM